MTKLDEQDEQAAWELLGQHRPIEPSFGFVERTLRQLDDPSAAVRPAWWRLPTFRWAGAASLVMLIGLTGWWSWQHTRQVRRAEMYAAIQQQDSLEDFDVIASLDQLSGKNNL